MSLGSIERRRRTNGTIAYRARIPLPPDAGGRRRTKCATFATEKAAQAWIVEELGRVHRGVVDTGSRLRLDAFLTGHWLPFYQGQRKPASYVVREGACRVHIIPALGHIALGKLTPGIVQTFYTDLSTRGLAPNTVGVIATTLSAALSAAVKWEMMHRNPAVGARLPHALRRPMSVWTPEQTRTFLAGESDPHWHCLWAVLAETGMRIGELLALTWDDVDWDASTLRVERTITKAGKGKGKTIGPTKTARGTREVVLSAACVTLLREAHQPRVIHDPRIFPISTDAVYERFVKATARLALPRIRLHDLRHTNVVTALEAGIPLIVISERLGHASIKITGDTYAHVTRRLNRESAETLGGLLLSEDAVDG